jgi:glycosyltransferase involved in cell wall biosynthesis
MQVLFIHQNFPGQYPHLVAALLARGDQVAAIGGTTARPIPGAPLYRYNPVPPGGVPNCHPWAADLQLKCFRAESVGNLLEQLRDKGLQPDLVMGHPGWGELLGVKDVLPGVPVLHHVEFFYMLTGGDADFDPELGILGWRDKISLRLRRTHLLQALLDLDWGLSPTQWQASTVPVPFRECLSVIHEGIDTEAIAPRAGSWVHLEKAGLTLRPGDEVVTFVARQLEPYRGFHRFMRMLPILQAQRPEVQVVIVGNDGASYGKPPAGEGTWRQVLLHELEGRLDLRRIHFVGLLPHPLLHELFRLSTCHVYLTVPFVLSWSMLEAMACGTLVVGSATPPVEEVICHGKNGLLVDFFDTEAQAATIASVLADPASYRSLAEAGRATVVEKYDLKKVCLPRQLQLVDDLAAGRLPTAPGVVD